MVYFQGLHNKNWENKKLLFDTFQKKNLSNHRDLNIL